MKKLLTMAVVASITLASSAQAVFIAGWDHNSYVAGFLSTDGATLTDTLDARYSDFDPTLGAGAEAGAFGTLYLDGSFGSTTTPLDGSDPYTSTSLSLTSNANRPVNGTPTPEVPFGANTTLNAEGVAPFASDVKMVSSGTSSVVYSADLSSILSTGSDWTFSFAGQTPGNSATVGVEFSTDGASYTMLADRNLNGIDSTFELQVAGNTSDLAFFRLTFDGSDTFIDNVAIEAATVAAVPEPGVVALIGSGLAGLAMLGRRRA